MRHPPDMHQLDEKGGALGLHRLGDRTPALHLRGSDQTRGEDVALTLGRGLGAFGNQQAKPRALRVIAGRQGRGRAIDPGARAGHRRHGKAVFQRDPAQRDRGPEVGHGAILSMIGLALDLAFHCRKDKPGKWNGSVRIWNR